MAKRLFGVYVLVELAVVVLLASTIGIGWTLLLLVGTFALGLALAGAQLRAHLRRLGAGVVDPRGAVTDGALVAIGTVLIVVPGLVSSLLGLLLLAPPTRALARPVVTALAVRRMRTMPLVVTTPGGVPHRAPRAAYVDGEVVEGEVVEGEVVDGMVVDADDATAVRSDRPVLPGRPPVA